MSWLQRAGLRRRVAGVDLTQPYDVVVMGGGNAAVCAAITAREAGGRVLIVESAPQDMRGGNSRHTRNLRAIHDGPTEVMTASYGEDEYWQDLLGVTGGETDEHLARVVIRGTEGASAWMAERGAHFQPALSGTLGLSRTNLFFLGGGRALLNSYYRHAERVGVDVVYDHEVSGLELDRGQVVSVTLKAPTGSINVEPRSVVAATGGFQANIEWLRRYWGDAADSFIIRGTPYAQGRVLACLLDQGVASAGDPSQFHAIALDARAPRFDGGIATRLDSVPFSIVVNCRAERFYDEGQDMWPRRYAIWGRLIAQQDEQIAYSIFDADALSLFMPSIFPPISAPTVSDLAQALGLRAEALDHTIDQYNAHLTGGVFDPTRLDGVATRGLAVDKTNWALPIRKPPFYAYPLRPGITFTYAGVKVDANARVQLVGERPCSNLFATGEIMSGNILGRGYLAGFGMAIGTVFGRIAGREAMRRARN